MIIWLTIKDNIPPFEKEVIVFNAKTREWFKDVFILCASQTRGITWKLRDRPDEIITHFADIERLPELIDSEIIYELF